MDNIEMDLREIGWGNMDCMIWLHNWQLLEKGSAPWSYSYIMCHDDIEVLIKFLRSC
jgi:hypothetical protein